MSRTTIHKDKAKFKQGFEITERYERQCDRHNSEKSFFAKRKQQLFERDFKKINDL